MMLSPSFLAAKSLFIRHPVRGQSADTALFRRHPLALIGTLVLVGASHAWLLYGYWLKPAPPPLKKAMPLPTIDIAFAAPAGRTVTPYVQPVERPAPAPKSDWVSPKKARSTVPVKKTAAQQTYPAKDRREPPPTAAPALSPIPMQEKVEPPPPEELTPASANADYLRNPSPEYPGIARSRRWEGEVLLKVLVLEDGRCGELAIHASSGHEVLDQAALNAVKNWRFVPAKLGGAAVASWVTVPIGFKLDS